MEIIEVYLRVLEDPEVTKLAERLEGLPLALATAGAYLRDVPKSFGAYLRMYEEQWQILEESTEALPEYDNRILYTTWNISHQHIANSDADVAEFMLFLAYFDPRILWYELFHECMGCGHEWLDRIVQSEAKFCRAMKKLQDYSLIDLNHSKNAYTMHPCVSDWLSARLKTEFRPDLFNLITHKLGKIASKWPDHSTYLRHVSPWQSYTHLEGHMMQIVRLLPCMPRNYPKHVSIGFGTFQIGLVLFFGDRSAEAEKMLQQVLKDFEPRIPPEHYLIALTLEYLAK